MAASLNWWEDEDQIAAYLQDREAPVDVAEQPDEPVRQTDVSLSLARTTPTRALATPAESEETPWWQDSQALAAYDEDLRERGLAAVPAGAVELLTRERSLGEEFSVGLERGTDQTQGLLYGFTGLLGQALGVEELEDFGLENYVRKMEEAAQNQATVQDPFEEIGGLGDAANYAAGLIGEQIPQLLVSLGGGGVGGFVGKTVAKRLVANEVGKRVAAQMIGREFVDEAAKKAAINELKDAASKEVAKEVAKGVLMSEGQAATRGGIAGAYLANFGQIAGGSFGQIAQETGEGDAAAAAAFAVPGAALDTLGEIFIAGKFLKPFTKTGRAAIEGVDTATGISFPGRVARNVGVGLPSAAALEGGTEYLQTGLEQAAVGAADPQRTIGEVVGTPEAERERQIAAAAGAVVGGGLGGAGSIIESLAPQTANALRQKTQQPRAEQPPVNIPGDPETGEPLPIIPGNWSDPKVVGGFEFRRNDEGKVAIFNPDPERFGRLPRFATPQGEVFAPLDGIENFNTPTPSDKVLAQKALGLFDDDEVGSTPVARTPVQKPKPRTPAREAVLEDGPDMTPAGQAVGSNVRFNGYEGTLAQDGARFLLRANDGTEVEVPAESEVEIVAAPAPTRLATTSISAVQTPTVEQPAPMPDLATMGAEEISKAALARPEVSIVDRAAETPETMDRNAVTLLQDARTTLESSIGEIESRDLAPDAKKSLTEPLYQKLIQVEDTLGRVPAEATALDAEIQKSKQAIEETKVERAKVAQQTVSRPPDQSRQFVESLQPKDKVTVYLSDEQADDSLSFNATFEARRPNGNVVVVTDPDAEGNQEKLVFTPQQYNRLGMFRQPPPKQSPVDVAVSAVLGPKPTKAKAERVFGTPYQEGQPQEAFFDDGLYANPGKTNKVPGEVRYFDKEGEPGVKEVVNFGKWMKNLFTTVRQMNLGLDVPVPDAELQNLPEGVQVEPRTMKNGQTANVVTKVVYNGNVYRRGDSAYDFSVNGENTGPGGFDNIYFNSPERLLRSERARKGKQTQKAKAGQTKGAVQAKLDSLDEADQFFVGDARARAARFIDRRTDLDPEAKAMASDEADASIIEQVAGRDKKGVPPVRDLALFKRFNGRMLDIFESNQENETEANVPRDVQEAARQISEELVASGQTAEQAAAAVEPIVARWQSYGDFSPIKTAMTKVQSAKKAAVRTGRNQRAAEADLAAGTTGQARPQQTPAERFNERTTDEAMAARERGATLNEEDREILGDFYASENLSESDQLRVEELLEYIRGEKSYDDIYPNQPRSRSQAAEGQDGGVRPGETRNVYGAAGELSEGRGQARVSGATESRGRGANRAGAQRGRNRVGRTDGGQAGTVSRTDSVESGRSGLGGTPDQRNASAARRAFVGSFIGDRGLVAGLSEAVVEKIYQAVSTTLDALAATKGRRVVAATEANMADLMGRSVEELVAGYQEEFSSYMANRERIDAIRRNAQEAVRSRIFEGPKAALEFMAQDGDRPAFMRMIAKVVLSQGQRFGLNIDDIAMQVGIFRRNFATQPLRGEEVRARVQEVQGEDGEGVFEVTTPDGVETYAFGGESGRTRKQAGKEARARAYDIVTGQTRTSWAGVLGVDENATSPVGRYSVVLNLDNWHEADDIGLTMLHEIAHVFSKTKFAGLENLNAVEKAAIKGIEAFRVRMLKAVARTNGLEVPAGNNPTTLAQLSRQVDDLSNPNVVGADADRRFAYLVNAEETARGLMESPEFLKLAVQLGLGKAKTRGKKTSLSGPVAEAWDDLVDLNSGRKTAATSPLANAFQDAWAATFGALEGTTEGYVKPPVGSNPLAQELAALDQATNFVEDQIIARGLTGTTAEREALLQEFMAARNMEQGAEVAVEEADADVDAIADPVTMSRAKPDVERNRVSLPGLTINGPSTYSIAVYHGSPYSFDRFNLSKIGTGEGAQTYGWGLYFAENREVAEDYQRSTSQPEIIYDGRRFKRDRQGMFRDESGKTSGTLPKHIEAGIAGIAESKPYKPKSVLAEEAESFLRTRVDYSYDTIQKAKAAIKNGEIELQARGNIYSLELDVEDDELLDWDRPLSEQSEKVRDALSKILDRDMVDWILNSTLKNRDGSWLYGMVKGKGDVRFLDDGSRKASETLLAEGIKGIRYLDQGSREQKPEVWYDSGLQQWIVGWDEGGLTTKILSTHNTEEGAKRAANNKLTYNYVIFDDSLIKIVTRNGERISVEQAATESRAISNESREALSNQGATNDRRNQPALQAATPGMGSASGGVQVQRQAVRPNAEPNPFVQEGVSAYNARYGLGEVVRGHYAPVDEQRARSIAAAYDALPVLDQGRETQDAYRQLAFEIQQQWDYAINQMGVTFEPWTTEGQPYANSREMVRDVRDNKHLWFFTGGEPHPLLNQPDADGLTMNDKLRAIHDLFGHAAEDYQFGPRGEENAWIKHSQMFTPLAQRALTTETRGQNSWVNYGAHNYGADGTRINVPASERPFATQKVALLPEEFMDWRGALAADNATESRAVAVSPSDVASVIRNAGGITVDIWTGDQPGTGYVVAPFKETETRILLNDFAPSDVRSFIQRFKGLLEVEGMHLGGWISGQQVYLDTSIVTNDELTATLIAQDGNQLAIFDRANFIEIPTRDLVERYGRGIGESRSRVEYQDLARSLREAKDRVLGGVRRPGRANVPGQRSLQERTGLTDESPTESRAVGESPNLIYQDAEGNLRGRPRAGSPEGNIGRALLRLQESSNQGRDFGAGETFRFRADVGGQADQALEQQRRQQAGAGFRRFIEIVENDGLVLDPESFENTVINGRDRIGDGSEHQVHMDRPTNRVIKYTNPDVTGSGIVGQSINVFDYLTNLNAHKKLFNIDIRLEGLVDLGEPFPRVVISQPFIKGRDSTIPEINSYFRDELKFTKQDDGSWIRVRNGEVQRVWDVVPGNVKTVTIGKKKVVVPFDVQISIQPVAGRGAVDPPSESRARGRVWRSTTRRTATGGTINQGGMFSVDELLDKRAGDLYRDSRMAIKADEAVIDDLTRQLRRQLRQFYKGVTPPLETINTALGNIENPLTAQQITEIEDLRARGQTNLATKKRDQYIRENRRNFKATKQTQALAQLPEELAATIREMSAHIESLSRRLPDEGLVNGDLAITVDEALGTYLNRSYAIFDDPKWTETVRKNAKVMDAARKYIRNNLAKAKTQDIIADAADEGRTISRIDAEAMANDSVTEDEVENLLESYLSIGAEAPTIEVLSGRIPGQKNLSMFYERGNIAPEIQALWGRYEDPTINYAKTVMKLSSVIANHQFLKELRDLGIQEGWLWSRKNNPNDTRHPPGYVRISTESNPTLAPLGGMYAHPDLAEGLFKMFPVGATEEHYWWLRAAMKLTGISMATKTVGSVASHVRNYGGGYLFLVAGNNITIGDIASGDFKKRFANARDAVLANSFGKYRNLSRAEWRAKIDDYIRRGVVGESITTGLLEDLLTASRRAGSPDWGDYMWGKLAEGAKKTADFATRAYSASDDWFHIMIYESEQDKYRQAFPDWDDNKVKEKAAQITRDIYPTYSLAPAIVQDLKKFPFIAPFVTFTTEVIRTTYNIQKLARQEIREGRASGNRELEALGWGRVRGMTIAAFLPAAVGATAMALAGISAEDEEDLRRFLPDWQKNSQLILFRKANGEVDFVDVSFLDPYEYFKKPLVAFTRSLRNADSADDILLKGTMDMVRQALDPFTSEQIFAGAIMDVMRNRDAAGRQVYNPQDTGANIGLSVARKIFYDPFVPGTVNSVERIGKAAFGIESETGRAYNLFNEISSVALGQRVSSVDAQQALQFKSSRFMREMRDASALFNREFTSQGTRSAGDVIDGYERSNAARRSLIDSIRKDYLAAIRLGVPVQRAKAILRDGGLGRDTLKMVTTGIYKPYDASEQSLDLVRARGKTDRISAYNQARRSAAPREILPD